jgi:hypothetical protein
VITALASFVDRVFEMLRELPRVRRDHKRKGILREMLEDPAISGAALAFWHV